MRVLAPISYLLDGVLTQTLLCPVGPILIQTVVVMIKTATILLMAVVQIVALLQQVPLAKVVHLILAIWAGKTSSLNEQFAGKADMLGCFQHVTVSPLPDMDAAPMDYHVPRDLTKKGAHNTTVMFT